MEGGRARTENREVWKREGGKKRDQKDRIWEWTEEQTKIHVEKQGW